MGSGVSLFFLVIGAILTFAVETDSAEGININNVGIILMVVGVIGLIVSTLVWDRYWNGRRGATVIEERPVAARPVVVQPVVQQPVAPPPVVEVRDGDQVGGRRYYS